MRQAKNKNTLTRLGTPKRKLPKAWTRALGLLKHKKIDGLAYQKKYAANGMDTWNGRFAFRVAPRNESAPCFVTRTFSLTI